MASILDQLNSAAAGLTSTVEQINQQRLQVKSITAPTQTPAPATNPAPLAPTGFLHTTLGTNSIVTLGIIGLVAFIGIKAMQKYG